MSNLVYSTPLSGSVNLIEAELEDKRKESKAYVDKFLVDSCYESWDDYMEDTQEDFMDDWLEKETEELNDIFCRDMEDQEGL